MKALASPAQAAALALAVALALLALGQWRASSTFVKGAVEATADVVSVRTAKRGLLDGSADQFATVTFTPDGSLSPITAEVPNPIDKLNFTEESIAGQTLPILYDPAQPQNVRFGKHGGTEGALVLLALAVGALFIPMMLRLSAGAQGGG